MLIILFCAEKSSSVSGTSDVVGSSADAPATHSSPRSQGVAPKKSVFVFLLCLCLPYCSYLGKIMQTYVL